MAWEDGSSVTSTIAGGVVTLLVSGCVSWTSAGGGVTCVGVEGLVVNHANEGASCWLPQELQVVQTLNDPSREKLSKN